MPSAQTFCIPAVMQMRVLELAKLGFEHVVIPSAAPELRLTDADLCGLKVVRQPTLRSALEYLFGPGSLKNVPKAVTVQQQGGSNGSSGGGGGKGRRYSRRSKSSSSSSSSSV
jgi:hypothetical protein